jgi:hypothetical protein
MKKSFLIYMNFMQFTQMLETTGRKVLLDFKCKVKMPGLFKSDSSILDNLKICIDYKEEQEGGAMSCSSIPSCTAATTKDNMMFDSRVLTENGEALLESDRNSFSRVSEPSFHD